MESVKKVQNVVSNVVNDPALFKEGRYEIMSSAPLDLGSVSLGYSNGEPKIYLTKMVGQEGCIDWNLSSFISTWKTAIINKQFTPELTSLFQGVSNELMPGFTFDIAKFHWFLRPHAQNTKIGFALFGLTNYNILTNNDPNNISNLQFLSSNLGELIPLSSFVFRRVSKNIDIGDIICDIFIMISSTSNIFIQVCFKFLFKPEKLTKNIINGMSSNLSSTQSRNSSFNPTNINISQSSTYTDTNSNEYSVYSQNTKITKNTNDDDDNNGDDMEGNYSNKYLLYPSSTWKWLINNKFSLISISAVGLAISAASKGISKDLRVKL